MNAPKPPYPLYRTDTLPLENSFATLPPAHYTALMPTPLPDPYLVCASASTAALIGLDLAEAGTEPFIATFTGNRLLPESKPLSAVYSGHQFGVWAGQLGDGRAILLGDVPAPEVEPSGRLELQLKGAGLTPYSRMGDGLSLIHI